MQINIYINIDLQRNQPNLESLTAFIVIIYFHAAHSIHKLQKTNTIE